MEVEGRGGEGRGGEVEVDGRGGEGRKKREGTLINLQ